MTQELVAITSWDISIGDATGFVALILVGVSATMMLVRSKLLKLTKNIAAVRGSHIAVSFLAGIFMLAHITFSFVLPTSIPMDLGYVSVAVAVAVWLTGTAFLERLRDSLFFHGTLSTILAGLIMVHAATSSPNIPLILGQTMLGLTVLIMVANAAYHLRRVIARPKAPQSPLRAPARPPPQAPAVPR